MCRACLDAAKTIFPNLKGEEYGHLLWGATAYPFAGPEIVTEQLQRLRGEIDRPENADYVKERGELSMALGIAESEMDAAMREYRERTIREFAYARWEAAGRPDGRTWNSG
jgi:hypothetical protein